MTRLWPPTPIIDGRLHSRAKGTASVDLVASTPEVRPRYKTFPLRLASPGPSDQTVTPSWMAPHGPHEKSRRNRTQSRSTSMLDGFTMPMASHCRPEPQCSKELATKWIRTPRPAHPVLQITPSRLPSNKGLTSNIQPNSHAQAPDGGERSSMTGSDCNNASGLGAAARWGCLLEVARLRYTVMRCWVSPFRPFATVPRHVTIVWNMPPPGPEQSNFLLQTYMVGRRGIARLAPSSVPVPTGRRRKNPGPRQMRDHGPQGEVAAEADCH